MISLIKAQVSDIDFLLALRKETMKPLLEAEGIFLTEKEHQERIETYFEHGHILLWNKQRIGFIKYIEREAEIELIQFQIQQTHQKKGIGKKVLEYLIDKALKDHKKLYLKVLKNNPAKRLYERTNFVITGEDAMEYTMTCKLETKKEQFS